MLAQDSLYGRAADGATYRLRVLLEMPFGVTQRPVMDSGQRRRLLAINGKGRQTGCFTVGAGTSGARQVGNRVTLFDPAYPAFDSAGVGLCKGGNDAVGDACHV